MRKLLPLLLFTSLTFANEGNRVVDDDSSEFINQQDIEALREWIATKRQVTVKQVGGDLSISGEVRVEMQYANETKNGIKQRGPNSTNPNMPANQFDIEVNLMFDYRTDRNWASAKLEFDNDAGANVNVFNKLAIERAILGGRIIDGDITTLDVDMGRNSMGNVYDSKIQFGSFLDAVTLKLDLASDKFGDLYARFSPFLINEKRYQWGVVGELGLLNIFNTGLYTKYSIVDWDTKNLGTEILNQHYRFLNSQWILGWKFVPKWLNKVTTIYSALLVNSAAQGVEQTNFKKQNMGWYAGFSIGKVRNKGDWSIDFNYQYVQAQAVPIFDAGGIGRGNASRTGFYTLNTDGTGDPTSVATAVGKTNFQGVSVKVLYLLTDTLTIEQSYQHAFNANSNIGPEVNYNQYEIEFIYAF